MLSRGDKDECRVRTADPVEVDESFKLGNNLDMRDFSAANDRFGCWCMGSCNSDISMVAGKCEEVTVVEDPDANDSKAVPIGRELDRSDVTFFIEERIGGGG